MFSTKTVLSAVLSVGLGWGGVCTTDCVTCSPVCGVGVGVATQTMLCAVLSVELGWGGVCNTDRITCSPVCGVGVGWGLQHIPCYVRSCLWSWDGVGFATQTELQLLSVGLGWGGVCNTDRVTCSPVCGVGVGWGLQHGPCYV